MNPFSPFFKIQLVETALNGGDWTPEVKEAASQNPTLASLLDQMKTVAAFDPATLFKILDLVVPLLIQFLKKKGG